MVADTMGAVQIIITGKYEEDLQVYSVRERYKVESFQKNSTELQNRRDK